MTYMKQPRSGWTLEEDTVLRKNLHQGVSLSIIGDYLDKSRGAVAGRKYRLGLCSSTALQPVIRKKPGRVVRDSPGPKPKRLVSPLQPVLDGTYLTLMELKPHQCRWPINSPQPGDKFLFCGNGKKEDSSYCQYHYQLSTTGE